MTSVAIILVTISAFVHASWNLLGKRNNPSGAYFFVAAVFAAICLSPLLLIYRDTIGLLPKRIWMWVGLTSLLEAIYFTGLAGAYRQGDMSVAYPLARAIPVILVTLVTTGLSLGKPLNLIGVIGIILVVIGCLMLPLRSFRQVRIRDYLTACCLLAGLAAIGTAGYTLVDNQALHELQAVHGIGLARIEIAFLYQALGSIGIAILLGVSVLASRREREALTLTWQNGKEMAFITGFLIIGTYGLVLTAMEYADNVSYIAAFRQLSIPIGATLGIAVQKEAAYPIKLASIGIILSGLILIALV